MHKEIMSLSKLTIKDKYVPEKIKTITKKKKKGRKCRERGQHKGT